MSDATIAEVFPGQLIEMLPHEIDVVWRSIERNPWHDESPENVTITRNPADGEIALDLWFAGLAAILRPRAQSAADVLLGHAPAEITSRSDIVYAWWIVAQPEKYAAFLQAQRLIDQVRHA